MSWYDAITLGRVSNLPTVWTNTMAAIVLAGGTAADPAIPPLLIALSLAYVGGMYLNDAFDAEIDARERPDRPIPSGRVSRAAVFTAGVVMLAGSILLVAVVAIAFAEVRSLWPAVAAIALAATIVVYDWDHKMNPLSPVLMGLCRALVYGVAGLAVATKLPDEVVIGALLLLSYIVGLTYLAKQETLGAVSNLWPLLFLAAPLVHGAWLAVSEPLVWPFLVAFTVLVALAVALVVRREPGDIGKAVVLLLAGICLFDAVLIAGAGAAKLALIAMAGFFLTLVLQRFVPGT
jgi:hypothetical protein